jgi:hypothetical protein
MARATRWLSTYALCNAGGTAAVRSVLFRFASGHNDGWLLRAGWLVSVALPLSCEHSLPLVCTL